MNHRYFLANAILWTVAIVVMATDVESTTLAMFLFPALAAAVLLATWPKSHNAQSDT
ncbi:MAG TPA: hypothetical protein VGN07_16570 [Steroidobacteraceae bacterium]|jgi:hypothetical protein